MQNHRHLLKQAESIIEIVIHAYDNLMKDMACEISPFRKGDDPTDFKNEVTKVTEAMTSLAYHRKHIIERCNETTHVVRDYTGLEKADE